MCVWCILETGVSCAHRTSPAAASLVLCPSTSLPVPWSHDLYWAAPPARLVSGVMVHAAGGLLGAVGPLDAGYRRPVLSYHMISEEEEDETRKEGKAESCGYPNILSHSSTTNTNGAQPPV